jgi:hypothetical protein
VTNRFDWPRAAAPPIFRSRSASQEIEATAPFHFSHFNPSSSLSLSEPSLASPRLYPTQPIPSPLFARPQLSKVARRPSPESDRHLLRGSLPSRYGVHSFVVLLHGCCGPFCPIKRIPLFRRPNHFFGKVGAFTFFPRTRCIVRRNFEDRNISTSADGGAHWAPSGTGPQQPSLAPSRSPSEDTRWPQSRLGSSES